MAALVGPDVDAVVHVNGLDIHYTDWNTSSGDTTLLVHGLMKELHVWDSVARELAAQRRVICVDLRGHGASDWSERGYALESFTEDLAALLDELGVHEIQLVGHSLGARIGIMFATTWSGKVRHLLLSDSGPEFPLELALSLRDMSRSAQTWFESEEAALATFRSANPDWDDEFHVNSLRNEYRTNWVGRVVPRADPELRWMVETEWVDGNPRLWECWTGLTCPVTVLWASESSFLSDELVTRMRERQPNFTLHRPRGTHWYLRQSPEEFLTYATAALAP